MTQMLREKKEKHIGIKPERPIPVSGLVASEMGTESKYGRMVPAMRETGRTIELKVSENSPISMETFMRETG